LTANNTCIDPVAFELLETCGAFSFTFGDAGNAVLEAPTAGMFQLEPELSPGAGDEAKAVAALKVWADAATPDRDAKVAMDAETGCGLNRAEKDAAGRAQVESDAIVAKLRLAEAIIIRMTARKCLKFERRVDTGNSGP
jgi:hypothetical protein